MYKIFADNTLIYDSTIEDYKINKGTVTKEINKSGSFTFSMYPDHFYYYQFVKLRTVLKVLKDNKIAFRGRILNDSSDHWNNNSFTCEGELGFFQDSIVRPFEFTGTVADLFTYFVNQHNSQVDEFKRFKIGRITVKGNTDIELTTYGSTLDTMTNQLINGDSGGYFVITHGDDGTDEIPTIHYLADFEKVSSQKIEFGVNLKNYTKKENAESIATAIIPIGGEVDEEIKNDKGETETVKKTIMITSVNNGKDYVYDEDAVKKRGWIFKTVEWKDIVDPSELKKKAEEYVKNISLLSVTLELTALDLHLFDRSIESYELGDYIPVESMPHNAQYTMLCSRQTLDILKPDNDTITLGHTYSSFTETTNKVQATFNNIVNIQATLNRVSSKVGSITGDTSTIKQDIVNNYNEIKNDLGTITGENKALAEAITTNAQNISLNAENISINAQAIADIISRLEALESQS